MDTLQRRRGSIIQCSSWKNHTQTISFGVILVIIMTHSSYCIMNSMSSDPRQADRCLAIEAVAQLLPGFAERRRHASSTGLRLLQASDIQPDGTVDWSGLAICEARPAAERARVHPGDVLITVRTSTPRAILVEHPPADAVAGSPFTVLRPYTDRIEVGYLHWVLNVPSINERLRASFRGSAMPFLAMKDLALFSIPVPDLARQRLIAHADQLRRRAALLATRLDGATNQLLEAAASSLALTR